MVAINYITVYNCYLSAKFLFLDLAPFIRELIMLNECIILPGFGGFETSYVGAKINPADKRMMPPSKEVVFRDDYKKGGEALTNHIAKQTGIKIEQAAELVSAYTSEIKEKLDNKEELVIGGVGKFSTGTNGRINFTPFSDENYLAESFGLEPLRYDAGLKERTIKKEAKNESRPNTVNYIIIGLIVIGLLLSLTIFLSTRLDIYLFDFKQENSSNKVLVLGISDYDSSYKEINSEIIHQTSVKQALQYEPDTSLTLLEDKNYLLVAGSFKKYKNANILSNKLIEEGFSSTIIENKGNFRVCVGSFNNKEEALNELNRLRRSIDRSIWLLPVL